MVRRIPACSIELGVFVRKQREYEYAELTIESVGFEGISVARSAEGLVHFVAGGIPGDVVVARITRKKKNYAEAEVERIVKASPQRVEPVCSHFGDCGGCKWQQFDYAGQVEWKARHVVDAFERLGKIPYGVLLEPIGCEQQYRYRNKMEFSFGTSRWLTRSQIESGADFGPRDRALGLHIPGRFDKVLDVDMCHLHPEEVHSLVGLVRAEAWRGELTIWETKHHTGFLRNLVLRSSVATSELMVIVVTSPVTLPEEAAFVEWLREQLPLAAPQVTTIIHAVNHTKSSVAVGEPEVLYGSGVIAEEVLGVRFRISPFSFFQTNTRQTERLFAAAIDAAGLTPETVLWDLYCGAGSISLCAAKRAKYVVGVEVVESAVLDARANAVANGIGNVEFHAEDMRVSITGGALQSVPRPDVIIVDPPRAGMHPEVVQRLGESGVQRIVYVSCNPATQARDCAMLAEYGYAVMSVQPVDMFPQTYHVENIAVLERAAQPLQ